MRETVILNRAPVLTAIILPGEVAASERGRKCSLTWMASTMRPSHPRILEQFGRKLCFPSGTPVGTTSSPFHRVRNSVAVASWAIFDIYRNPELLASVRAEVDACANICEDGRIRFDIDDLLRQPVLQAVYAETLLLRMHFYIIRMPDKIDMNIGHCVIPRQKVTVTPTTVAHMDSEAWSTGSRNDLIDQFWHGRFLKDTSKNALSGTDSHESSASPTFSTKELEGSWIPYGGGPRQCPGRHFAKRRILLTTALMVTFLTAKSMGRVRICKRTSRSRVLAAVCRIQLAKYPPG